MENDLILQNFDEGSDGMLPTTSCSLPSSSGISSLLDRVICGDNCETLAAMPAESVDLVVTSPPYDDLRTYGRRFVGIEINPEYVEICHRRLAQEVLNLS